MNIYGSIHTISVLNVSILSSFLFESWEMKIGKCTIQRRHLPPLFSIKMTNSWIVLYIQGYNLISMKTLIGIWNSKFRQFCLYFWTRSIEMETIFNSNEKFLLFVNIYKYAAEYTQN